MIHWKYSISYSVLDKKVKLTSWAWWNCFKSCSSFPIGVPVWVLFNKWSNILEIHYCLQVALSSIQYRIEKWQGTRALVMQKRLHIFIHGVCANCAYAYVVWGITFCLTLFNLGLPNKKKGCKTHGDCLY